MNPFLCPVEMVTLVGIWMGGLTEFTDFLKPEGIKQRMLTMLKVAVWIVVLGWGDRNLRCECTKAKAVDEGTRGALWRPPRWEVVYVTLNLCAETLVFNSTCYDSSIMAEDRRVLSTCPHWCSNSGLSRCFGQKATSNIWCGVEGHKN